PRFSGVTRCLTNVTPWASQGRRASSLGSKSRMVMWRGSTLTCLTRMGSVQRATAPKPTNNTRWLNASIPLPPVWPGPWCARYGQEMTEKGPAGPAGGTSRKLHTRSERSRRDREGRAHHRRVRGAVSLALLEVGLDLVELGLLFGRQTGL